MKVKDLMRTDVKTLSFDTSYEDAAKFLLDNDITGCPVLNEAGDVVGIISDKDLYKVLYPYYNSFYESPELYTDMERRESKINEIRKNPIERFMARDIVSARPDDAIMKVGGMMLARGIHRMPVIEKDGSLVGIITRGQIFKTIIKKNIES